MKLAKAISSIREELEKIRESLTSIQDFVDSQYDETSSDYAAAWLENIENILNDEVDDEYTLAGLMSLLHEL